MTTDWKAYVKEQAETHGVEYKLAWQIFEVLGEEEAYDSFICTLEDIAAGIL